MEYLNHIYPESTKTETELPFEAESLVDSYLGVEESIKALTTQKNEIANQLKSMMMDSEKGHAGAHTVKWMTVQKQTLDTKKVKEALGEKYGDYLQTSSYRKFSIA